MGAFGDFFSGLFSTDAWPPRWNCGDWTDFHGWLYISSDLIIWLAYFILPIILISFIQKRPDFKYLPIIWLFATFIVLCGITHLLDAILFWWPAYRLSAIIRFTTAVISMITVFYLIRDLPALFTGFGKDSLNDSFEERSPGYFLEVIKTKEEEIKLLKEKIDKLSAPKE